MPAQKKNESNQTQELRFTKDSLVSSTQFTRTDRDILNLVLDESKNYSLKEVKEELKKFKGGI